MAAELPPALVLVDILHESIQFKWIFFQKKKKIDSNIITNGFSMDYHAHQSKQI